MKWEKNTIHMKKDEFQLPILSKNTKKKKDESQHSRFSWYTIEKLLLIYAIIHYQLVRRVQKTQNYHG